MIPWRLIGAGALVAAFMLAGWRVNTWHASYKALPGVRAALKAEESCGPDSRCAQRHRALEERQAKVSQEVIDGYEKALADLRNRPVPDVPVRLCRPRGQGNVRGPNATRAADGSAPGGELSVEISADIGQRLFDLADEADREALKLKYLQDWNRALAAD